MSFYIQIDKNIEDDQNDENIIIKFHSFQYIDRNLTKLELK